MANAPPILETPLYNECLFQGDVVEFVDVHAQENETLHKKY